MHIKPLLICTLGPSHHDRTIKCFICNEYSFNMISVFQVRADHTAQHAGRAGPEFWRHLLKKVCTKSQLWCMYESFCEEVFSPQCLQGHHPWHKIILLNYYLFSSSFWMDKGLYFLYSSLILYFDAALSKPSPETKHKNSGFCAWTNTDLPFCRVWEDSQTPCGTGAADKVY